MVTPGIVNLAQNDALYALLLVTLNLIWRLSLSSPITSSASAYVLCAITLNLEEIAKACAFALKFGGRVAMLHRADRVAELVYTLKKYRIEVKRLQFVCGKDGDKPYLVMVEGVKGGKPAVEVLPTICNVREN